MELILQQMPIVVHSLNIGFLQTLRLFLVTLIGAFPLAYLGIGVGVVLTRRRKQNEAV